MTSHRYKTFDLCLEWNETWVTLKHPSGNAAQPLTEQVPWEQLEQRVWNTNRATAEEQQQFGATLFNLLFPADKDLGKQFRQELHDSYRLRLRLLYPEDEQQQNKLLGIPWEFVYYDPSQNQPTDGPPYPSGFLCMHSNFSLVHKLPPTGQQNLDPQVGKIPVKVQLLAAGIGTDYYNLMEHHIAFVDEQTEPADGGKRIVELVRSAPTNDPPGANLAMVQSAMETNDVVHLVAHGDPGKIVLNNEYWTALVGSMTNPGEHQARLVVLDSCYSMASCNNVAALLQRCNTPVVVGFTSSVEIPPGLEFMANLYFSLAKTGCNLEQAVAFARKGLVHQRAIDAPTDEEFGLDWGALRVFLAAENSELIPEAQLYAPVHDMIRKFDAEMNLKLAEAGLLAPEEQEPTILDEITRWFAQSSPRVLYLNSLAGGGKTTQVAALRKQYPNQPITAMRGRLYHFCKLSLPTDKTRTSDDQLSEENTVLANHPLVFVRDSLYPQLETLFGAERYRGWVNDAYPLMINDASIALNQLVIEPLRKAQAAQAYKDIVLVVDGLDHAQHFEPGFTILDLLIDHIQPLTEVMRLLVTAASDHGEAHLRIKSLLAQVQPEKTGTLDMQAIELPAALARIDALVAGCNYTSVTNAWNKFRNTDPSGNKWKTALLTNYQFINFIKQVSQSPNNSLLAELFTRCEQAGPDKQYLSFPPPYISS